MRDLNIEELLAIFIVLDVYFYMCLLCACACVCVQGKGGGGWCHKKEAQPHQRWSQQSLACCENYKPHSVQLPFIKLKRPIPLLQNIFKIFKVLPCCKWVLGMPNLVLQYSFQLITGRLFFDPTYLRIYNSIVNHCNFCTALRITGLLKKRSSSGQEIPAVTN